MYQICQSRVNILPNKKKLSKIAKDFANWRNFAQSGHTAKGTLIAHNVDNGFSLKLDSFVFSRTFNTLNFDDLNYT